MPLPHRPMLLPSLALAAALALAPAAVPAHEPAAMSPEAVHDRTILGAISYYSRAFAGRLTASGERFDPEEMTMAHPWLPFGTLVRVTMPETSRSVVLRVNDRGPFSGSRVADVSPAAARILGFVRRGLASAHLEVLSPAAGSRPEASRSSR